MWRRALFRADPLAIQQHIVRSFAARAHKVDAAPPMQSAGASAASADSPGKQTTISADVHKQEKQQKATGNAAVIEDSFASRTGRNRPVQRTPSAVEEELKKGSSKRSASTGSAASKRQFSTNAWHEIRKKDFNESPAKIHQHERKAERRPERLRGGKDEMLEKEFKKNTPRNQQIAAKSHFFRV